MLGRTAQQAILAHLWANRVHVPVILLLGDGVVKQAEVSQAAASCQWIKILQHMKPQPMVRATSLHPP